MLPWSLSGLAYDLDKFGPEALPGSFDQLCDRVEQVEGVRFRELCERLPKRAKDGDQLLKELIEIAKDARSQKRDADESSRRKMSSLKVTHFNETVPGCKYCG